MAFFSDGAIYTVIVKVMNNVYTCRACSQSFYGKEKFEEHECVGSNDCQPSREFDWIVPLPGLLHLEMNAAKAFMNLNWEVFMEIFAKQLGFTSENALKYIRKGSDHHKLWQILEITYLALVDELLLPYVRSTLKENK